MNICFGLEIPKPVYVLLKNSCCQYTHILLLFVGTVTTEAATPEATTGTTGMNFYSVLNTCLMCHANLTFNVSCYFMLNVSC